MPIKRIFKPREIEESRWFEMMDLIMKMRDSTILKKFKEYTKYKLETKREEEKRDKREKQEKIKKHQQNLKKAYKEKQEKLKKAAELKIAKRKNLLKKVNEKIKNEQNRLTKEREKARKKEQLMKKKIEEEQKRIVREQEKKRLEQAKKEILSEKKIEEEESDTKLNKESSIEPTTQEDIENKLTTEDVNKDAAETQQEELKKDVDNEEEDKSVEQDTSAEEEDEEEEDEDEDEEVEKIDDNESIFTQLLKQIGKTLTKPISVSKKKSKTLDKNIKKLAKEIFNVLKLEDKETRDAQLNIILDKINVEINKNSSNTKYVKELEVLKKSVLDNLDENLVEESESKTSETKIESDSTEISEQNMFNFDEYQIDEIKRISQIEANVDRSKLLIRSPDNFKFKVVSNKNGELKLDMPLNSIYLITLKSSDPKIIFRNNSGKYNYIEEPLLFKKSQFYNESGINDYASIETVLIDTFSSSIRKGKEIILKIQEGEKEKRFNELKKFYESQYRQDRYNRLRLNPYSSTNISDYSMKSDIEINRRVEEEFKKRYENVKDSYYLKQGLLHKNILTKLALILNINKERVISKLLEITRYSDDKGVETGFHLNHLYRLVLELAGNKEDIKRNARYIVMSALVNSYPTWVSRNFRLNPNLMNLKLVSQLAFGNYRDNYDGINDVILWKSMILYINEDKFRSKLDFKSAFLSVDLKDKNWQGIEYVSSNRYKNKSKEYIANKPIIYGKNMLSTTILFIVNRLLNSDYLGNQKMGNLNLTANFYKPDQTSVNVGQTIDLGSLYADKIREGRRNQAALQGIRKKESPNVSEGVKNVDDQGNLRSNIDEGEINFEYDQDQPQPQTPTPTISAESEENTKTTDPIIILVNQFFKLDNTIENKELIIKYINENAKIEDDTIRLTFTLDNENNIRLGDSTKILLESLDNKIIFIKNKEKNIKKIVIKINFISDKEGKEYIIDLTKVESQAFPIGLKKILEEINTSNENTKTDNTSSTKVNDSKIKVKVLINKNPMDLQSTTETISKSIDTTTNISTITTTTNETALSSSISSSTPPVTKGVIQLIITSKLDELVKDYNKFIDEYNEEKQSNIDYVNKKSILYDVVNKNTQISEYFCSNQKYEDFISKLNKYNGSYKKTLTTMALHECV